MHKPIYFNGAGLITAQGINVNENIKHLTEGATAPSVQTIKQSSGTHQVPYFTIKSGDIPSLENSAERIHVIIKKVIQEAISEAGLSNEQVQQAGLFIGSTSFHIATCETAIKKTNNSDENINQKLPPFTDLSKIISQTFSISGPAFTFSTACTSSANALIYASEMIRSEQINHAIVVGLEFFNETTALGFSSLGLVSASKMQPFSEQRNGICLGEGCSALVISAKKTTSGFSFLAGANIGDNFSITASDPEGNAVSSVINKAIKNAGINTCDIAMVKAHGTATASNDEAEYQGMKNTFTRIPPICALKPLLGHTLGACGINELIVFYKSIEQGLLPSYKGPIHNDWQLHYASTSDIKNSQQHSQHYLLNYFGFGGNSTALVIKHD